MEGQPAEEMEANLGEAQDKDSGSNVEATAGSSRGEGAAPRYKVRSGGGIIPPLKGNLYQIEIAALLALRGIQHDFAFSITFEEQGLGTFDDVTFRFENEVFLMQAKHSVTDKEIKAEEFLKPKGDFSLQEHFCSFLGCQWLAKQKRERIMKSLLFTNMAFNGVNSPDGPFLEECDLPESLDNLLSGSDSKGRDDPKKFYKFSTKSIDHLSGLLDVAFTEDPKNQKNIEKGAKDYYKGLSSADHASLKKEYLETLILAVNQPNQEALKLTTKDTFKRVKLTTTRHEGVFIPEEHIDTLDKCLHTFVLDWASKCSWKKKEREALTSGYVLNDCFGAFFRTLVESRRSLMKSSITFCTETPVAAILKGLTHRLNILVTDQPNTCAFLTDFTLRKKGEIVTAFPWVVCHEAQRELLWGYCRYTGTLLLVEDASNHGDKVLRVARQLTDINDKIKVFVISSRRYQDGSCVQVPEVKPTHMTKTSLQDIMSFKVNYQGQLVDLACLGTKEDIQSIIDGAAVESLVSYDPQHMDYFMKVGQILRPRPRIYQERDMESSQGTLSEDKIVQLLLNGQHVIITAPAGAGKSTLLDSICLSIKEIKPDFWVVKCDLEKARGLFPTGIRSVEGDNPASCFDFVKRLVNIDQLSPFDANIFKLASSGKMAILFDSFDVLSVFHQDLFLDLVEGLLKTQTIICISSRTSPRQHLRPLSLQSFSLCSLREWEQEELLARLLGKTENPSKECRQNAAKILGNHPVGEDVLEPFYGNPQHLTMVADLFFELKDELHTMNRLQIYQSFINQLFQKYWKSLGILDTSHERMVLFKHEERIELENLYQLFAIKVLNPAPHDIYKPLEMLVTRRKIQVRGLGLVSEWVNGEYEFLHRTYAEYYFSLYLANHIAEGTLPSDGLLDVFMSDEYALVRYFLDRQLKDIHQNKHDESGCRSWPPEKVTELSWPSAGAPATKLVQLILHCNQHSPPSLYFLPNRNCLDTALLENLQYLSAYLWTNMHLIPEKEMIDVFFAAALAKNSFVLKQSLRALLRNGFDINQPVTTKKVTALHVACASLQPYGNLDQMYNAVQLLLFKGANINALTDEGESPLHFAVRSVKPSVVKLLLQGKAKVDTQTKSGMTALHYAATDGKEDMIDLLISNDSDVKAKTAAGETALHLAVKSNHESAVKLLLESGCDVDAVDAIKMAAIHYAAKAENIGIVQSLVDAGCNVLLRSDSGKLPVEETGQPNIQNILIKATTVAASHPLLIMTTSNAADEVFPLHLASLQGDAEMCHMLLKLGADVNVKSLHGKTPLHDAVFGEHAEVVKLLHDYKCDMNAQDKDGVTALHYASQHGHTKMVKLLHDYKCDINLQDKAGITPLHVASQNGHTEIVKLLHDFKCDMKVQNKDGRTALHYASQNGHTEIVKLLHDYKCDINLEDKDGITPLLLASINGHKEVVKLLHDCKCDMHVQDRDGRTALHYASLNGHTKIVKLLHDYKCNINLPDKGGITPLHVASCNGHQEVVNLLYNYKCDVNVQDKDGVSPLHLASQNGQADIVKLLHGFECNMDVQDMDGRTALHDATDGGHAEIVKMLLDYKCDMKVQDKDGRTALHIASCYGHKEVVKLLHDYKCDMKVQDKDGRTALHYASQNGHTVIAKLLLHYKCDINLPDKAGITPLHVASQNGQADIVKLLHGFECNMDVQDMDGRTALHDATDGGHAEIVKMLLDYKCDMKVQDKDGRTALHLAAYSGHTMIVKLLHDYKCDMKVQNKDGRTALHYASQNGHTDIVKLLHDKCDINLEDKDGITPLLLASFNGHKEVVKLLHDCKCDMKVQDRNGRTALHYASQNGLTKIVKLLHDYQCNMNLPDKGGITPLHVASCNGHQEVVNLLYNYKCDVNVQNKDGRTALHYASQNGHTEIVKLLHDYKCDINLEDKDGITPLLLASFNGHKEIVKLLHDYKCDINLQDRDGKTALHVACLQGHAEIVELLLSYKCDKNLPDKTGITPRLLASDCGYGEIVKLFDKY